MKNNMDKITQRDQYIEIEWSQRHIFGATALNESSAGKTYFVQVAPSTCRTAIRASGIFVIEPIRQTGGTLIITRLHDADGHYVYMEIYCMPESVEHFKDRLNSRQKIILLDDDGSEAAISDTGAISGRPAEVAERKEEEVKGISEYTAAVLMNDIEQESLVSDPSIGFVSNSRNTTVSVCARHNGDRTNYRISHLESEDGHITIVCDEEDDDDN